MQNDRPIGLLHATAMVVGDSVNFDTRAIRLAIDFAGIDHIVAGSDYPHRTGSIPKTIAAVGDRANVFAANAARILKLQG